VASVLVIEDDQRIREALASGLAGAGHAVRTEATGAAALTAAIDWQPEVIVLDLGLPDLDGTDVLRMLRGVSDVPVIVATARDDEAEIVRSSTRAPTTTWSSRTRPPSSRRASGRSCVAAAGPRTTTGSA
jgi:DNA-binding response OmpR family regulator